MASGRRSNFRPQSPPSSACPDDVTANIPPSRRRSKALGDVDSSKNRRRQPKPRKPRKVNATCRVQRRRCDGNSPCSSCTRRSIICIPFDTEDREVTVRERYVLRSSPRAENHYAHEIISFLNDLKRKAQENTSDHRPNNRSRQESSPGRHHRTSDVEDTGARSCSSDELPDTNISNPLGSERSRFLVDGNGRRRFLGPSSTWAYTRQLIVDIQQHFNQPSIPDLSSNVDGNAYAFDSSTGGDIPFTKAELPSLDYAIYLTNTVQFHIAQLYHLFDQTLFMNGLHKFYESDVPEPPQSKLWYIQYLLIISFGKTFLIQTSAEGIPPGAVFFARAMKLLPGIPGLLDDPLLSVEILCAAALYLQCLDHRNSAYVYLGIALRIALSKGLHREADLEGLDEESCTRSRSLWWTLYILDRRFSLLMGTPSSINDSDVTMGLPDSSISDQRCRTLAMHIRISRIIPNVLDCQYLFAEKFAITILNDGSLPFCVLSCLWIRWEIESILSEECTKSPPKPSCSRARS
ncbi:unnamed protein product [Penicillium salamii]|nr:unnamed protein product [Penicillium salamii]